MPRSVEHRAVSEQQRRIGEPRAKLKPIPIFRDAAQPIQHVLSLCFAKLIDDAALLFLGHVTSPA
jgi:hypothetical protein